MSAAGAFARIALTFDRSRLDATPARKDDGGVMTGEASFMGAGRIAFATLVAGVLDIGIAFTFAAYLSGGTPARVLAGIASGPFGAEVAGAPWAPAVGLAIHFSIMAVMVGFFAFIASRFPGALLRLGPVLTGIVYGLVLYAFMYWVVLPLRWPEVHPQTGLAPVARAIFAHVVMVGLPIAFILWPRGAARSVAIPATAGS